MDKAKVELIVKLPSPTTVKGVKQFLGHVGSIGGISKISLNLRDLFVNYWSRMLNLYRMIDAKGVLKN